MHVRLINRASERMPDMGCTPLTDWPNGCWFSNLSRCYTAISRGGYDHCGWDYGAGCYSTDACGVDY